MVIKRWRQYPEYDRFDIKIDLNNLKKLLLG
jgi:hypothetical protein